MEQADADIMCFGHTHKPYQTILPTEQTENTHFRHAINIGSVGKPKDNNPTGCYVILTINDNSSIANKESVQVEFIRFGYDVEKAAKAVEDSPLPNEFADMLRKEYQYNKGLIKSGPCSEINIKVSRCQKENKNL